MARRNVVVIAAVVIVVSATTIVASELIADPSAEAPASTTTTTSSTTSTTTSTTTTTTTTTTTLRPDVERIATELDRLGLEGQVREVLMFGAGGPEVELQLAEELGTTCVGGVFVASTAGNWSPSGSIDAAIEAVAAIATASAACPTPPLIATDAEVGSRVLKVPVTPLPSPATLETNHLADPGTTSIALVPAVEAFATELASIGVHVNFGVVADVDVEPGTYMDRQGRSFGADPAVVAAITATMVEGHCAAGVAAALKHFPNQGSAVEDPHRLDSFSINDPDAWASFGALPYIETRAPLVMTGHIRYEGVDNGTPASLSGVITSWLRADLAYDGVIITDDMHVMRGVGSDLTPAQRAIAALRAGADLALFVGADDAADIVAGLVAEASANAAFADRIAESAARVLRLKGALGLIPGASATWFDWCGAPGASD